MIIIPVTSYFIAVHGLYLQAAQSHSFQFLFPFWVEHRKKSLPTMSNKMCNPQVKKGYGVEHHGITAKLLIATENACFKLKTEDLLVFYPN